jgi:hypothetical protein
MVFKTPLPYFPDLITLIMCHGIGQVELESCEHFQKSSIRNRCYIRSANGLMRLSIPVISEDRRHTDIINVRIAYHTNWKKHHLDCIKTAYGNTPFFEHYIDEIAKIFHKQHETIWALNLDIWEFVHTYFLKSAATSFSQTYVPPLQKVFSDRRAYHKEIDYLNSTSSLLEDYQQLPSFIPYFSPGLSCLDLLFFQGPYFNQWLEDSFQIIHRAIHDFY